MFRISSTKNKKGLYKKTNQGRRVHSHVFEHVVRFFMIFFGIGSLVVAYLGLEYQSFGIELVMILMMIMIIMLILAQTIVLVRIFEKLDDK